MTEHTGEPATSPLLEGLVDRLAIPEAVLSRTDLALLGWQRRAVDAIFRQAARQHGLVLLPGYARPMITVATYQAVVAEATKRDGESVWP